MIETIQIHQTLLLPAAKGVKPTPVNVDGYAVINDDSLQSVLGGIKDTMSYQGKIFDGLSAKVNEISEYGVGFDDSVGVIAIPLIIALFAFAFTFLLTVITHINNDYESVPISRMFASSKPYARFMKISIGSVAFVIFIGALSLLFGGVAHCWLMKVSNWLLLFVALAYSVVILLFVKTCIRYNDPSQMIDLIDERYGEDMKGVEKFLKNQKKEEKKNETEKSEHRKYFKNMGFWYGRVYAGFNAEEERVNRLVDLFKYALRKKNHDLSLGVIQKADSLMKQGKRAGDEKDLHHVMEFYDRAIAAYLAYPQDKNVDEILMLYWSSCYNRKQLPASRYVYRTLGMMVEAVMSDHYGLFEEYVSHATGAYSYVNRMQVACYVRGESVEKQIETDKDRLEFWGELRDMHFLAAAHLFSLGHFEILRTLIFRKDKGYSDLFPNAGIEILKMYARCKKNQTADNQYNYYSASKVIGEYPDPEMLEKYTAAMLLMSSQNVRAFDVLCSKEKLNIIKKNKDVIEMFGKMWQGYDEIKRLGSNVATQDINGLIDQYITVLETGSSIREDSKKEWFIRLMECIANYFGCKEESKDLYDAEIPGLSKKNIGIHYWNWLYGNKGFLEDGLASDNDGSKDKGLPLGAYTYLIYKQVLLEQGGPNPVSLYDETMRVFKGRYEMLFYQAVTDMMIKDVVIEKDDVGDYVEGVLGTDGKEYVIVETGLDLFHFVELDKEKERKYPWRHHFKEAEIHSFDLNTNQYLRDVSDLEPFRGTLMLIKKADLPSLEREDKDASPEVAYKDESDRKKGVAAVRMTVDPKMVVKYNPNAVVIRVKVPLKWWY